MKNQEVEKLKAMAAAADAVGNLREFDPLMHVDGAGRRVVDLSSKSEEEALRLTGSPSFPRVNPTIVILAALHSLEVEARATRLGFAVERR